MPRPQLSRSSPANTHNSSPDTTVPPQHMSINKESPVKVTSPKPPLDALLGGNPQFADHFFGEPANLVRPLLPATHHQGAENGDMGETPAQNGRSGDGGSIEGPSTESPYQITSNDQTANPRVPDYAGHGYINIENTPISIDQLVIHQLREDLEAYRYDLDFARSQLDPANAMNISAAETRTFQLRILDLGHQMRMLNHRIQLMQATMNNSRLTSSVAGKAGTAASNSYWGPYPPGTSVHPAAHGASPSVAPIVNGFYGPGSGSGLPIMQSPAAYYGHPDRPQERRGPGRPLGSKNRPRPSLGPQQPPSVSENGSAKAAALASAAALANAGAKRDSASEIRVATPNGEPSDTIAAEDASTGEHPSKRIRLDVQVGSPMNSNSEMDERPTQNVITAASNDASFNQGNNEDVMDDEMQFRPTIGPTRARRTPSYEAIRPAPSFLAAPYGTPSAPVVPALSASSPPYDGPAGNEFKRLGGWRCRLCTSQKYLNAPPPKQPSEPGHWPLRDISKMVTHFTRMHGEHNNVERCMELGAALGANRGPFRHWLQITKKEKGIDHATIDTAVDELENGRMPAVLRKVSTSAANFPRD